jgi:hypothetical protein
MNHRSHDDCRKVREWLNEESAGPTPLSIMLRQDLIAFGPLPETTESQAGFKVKEARAAGYSDVEIASYLKLELRPDWHTRLSDGECAGH